MYRQTVAEEILWRQTTLKHSHRDQVLTKTGQTKVSNLCMCTDFGTDLLNLLLHVQSGVNILYDWYYKICKIFTLLGPERTYLPKKQMGVKEVLQEQHERLIAHPDTKVHIQN